jgi:hypothetical protein
MCVKARKSHLELLYMYLTFELVEEMNVEFGVYYYVMQGFFNFVVLLNQTKKFVDQLKRADTF